MMSDINPGVRRLVRWLNDRGFETCDSGDGETHDYACDRDYAYVVVQVGPDKLVAETDRIVRTLIEAGVQLRELDEEGAAPCVQSFYMPLAKAAFIEIYNVTDALLPPELN